MIENDAGFGSVIHVDQDTSCSPPSKVLGEWKASGTMTFLRTHTDIEGTRAVFAAPACLG